MDNSTFDPDAFINSTHDAGIDTRSTPHPAGDSFVGWIGTEEKDLNFKTTPKGNTILEIQIYTDDPVVVTETSRDPTRVRWSTFLDLTDTGGLDLSPGKNRRLGSLLTALGFQNLDGTSATPWKFTDFQGKPIRYSVNHRSAEDGSGNIYDEVSKVARVS